MNVLDETYNIQLIRREPIFEAKFNDIIEAKPSEYIPDEFRVLLRRANLKFDKIKDKMQGIQEIRQDLKQGNQRDAVDTKEFNQTLSTIVDEFKVFYSKIANKLLQQVKKTKPETEWVDALYDSFGHVQLDKILGDFFQTKKMKDKISQFLSNNKLTPSVRQSFLNMANGKGDFTTDWKVITNHVPDKFINDLLQAIEGIIQGVMKKIDKLAVKSAERITNKINQMEGIPKSPYRQQKQRESRQFFEEMRDSLSPLPKSKRRVKEEVKLYDDVESARKQVEAFRLNLSRKKNPQNRAIAEVQLENAEKILEQATQYQAQQQQEDEIEPRQLDFDSFIPRRETRAMKKARLAREAEEAKEAEELEKQTPARLRADELVRDIRELVQQDMQGQKQAGEEERKGRGKIKRKVKVNKKGGVKLSKSSRPDSEHLSRLKALLK